MYIIILDQKSMDDLLNKINYLGDSLLREFSMVHRGYVLPDGGMVGDWEPSDARLVFQMQDARTPCVEIIFEEVSELKLIDGLSSNPSPVAFVSDEKIEFFISGG